MSNINKNNIRRVYSTDLQSRGTSKGKLSRVYSERFDVGDVDDVGDKSGMVRFSSVGDLRGNMSSVSSLIDKKSLLLSNIDYKIADDFTMFKGLGHFVNYVLNECSNCVIRESCIYEICDSKIFNKFRGGAGGVLGDCGEIRLSEVSDEFLKDFDDIRIEKNRRLFIVIKILILFTNKGLLKVKSNSYFILGTNKRLTWNNLKGLKDSDIRGVSEDLIREITGVFGASDNYGKEYSLVTLIKSIFWFFRKAVVDSILNDIIYNMSMRKKFKVKALSVGSTKLSSDYDVSLDTFGDYDINAIIIQKYNNTITKLFNDSSESIFDTNVYGVSFVSSNKTVVFNKEHICNESKIFYANLEMIDIEVSQMIWSYVKLLLNMEMLLKRDDVFYEKMFSYMENGMNGNDIYLQALDFFNTNKSNVLKYSMIISNYKKYLDMNKSNNDMDENYLMNNFISFVNYNGSETYLTNGSFLDVVVNQQICLNKNTIDVSRPYIYFTSFMENMSDYMINYHKKKYLDRGRNALEKMIRLIDERGEYAVDLKNIYSDRDRIFKKIDDLNSRCVDIFNCKSFELMYNCIQLIVDVSKFFYKYITIEYKNNLYNSINKFGRIKFLDTRDNINRLFE